MRIVVKLTEPIWRAVGERQVVVEVDRDEASLAEVLESLVKAYPPLAKDFSRSYDVLDANYSVLLNSKLVSFARSQQIAVRDGDQMVIMLPLAGG